MNDKTPMIIVLVAAAAAAGAWLSRDTAPLRGLMRPLGLSSGAAPDTATTLAAAGVHKCRGAAGVVYSDHACTRGSREVSATGGTVTVMPFPKAAPESTSAAPAASAPQIVQALSREEIDRMRDQQIDQAANR